jgi:lactoylglutathione lyase
MADVLLSLLVLKTRQIEKMRAFYGALGIDLAEEQHGNGPVHYAGRIGNVVIELYPLPNDGAPTDSTTRLGFTVENLAVALERLQALGIPVPGKPQATEWGNRVVVRDPDGLAVELYEQGLRKE